MSSEIFIGKRPSAHNLEIIVKNQGPDVRKVLEDNQFTTVLVYGDGVVELKEIPKITDIP